MNLVHLTSMLEAAPELLLLPLIARSSSSQLAAIIQISVKVIGAELHSENI